MVVVVVLMLLLFFGKMMHEWWHESKLGPHRRRSLPPGDMGFPFIGNMWSFLHAFKSHHPDSFIASFVSRSLLLLLLLLLKKEIYKEFKCSIFLLSNCFQKVCQTSKEILVCFLQLACTLFLFSCALMYDFV